MKDLIITFDSDKETYREAILSLLQHCAINPPSEEELVAHKLYYYAIELLFDSISQTF